MGMFTEIYVNVDLKEDTPEAVIKVLQKICYQDSKYPDQWSYLFENGSYYTPFTSCANLSFNSSTSQYSLLGKGDLKNYNGEIEAFFEFLIPWVDGESGDFIGYNRKEQVKNPTLVFLP